ncbi:helix-turn-helix transcriptional regulator [Gilliamella apicola]|uniref:helix-turn-helix transcriptional regulator n=1 Tax=Gilliamella apicola TaxID=1196095 RepID=UPI003985E540
MKEILNNKDSLIPLKDFIALIGYKSTSSYYQMLKNDKTAPKPIKLFGRKVFLSSQEVNSWIESKKAARR